MKIVPLSEFMPYGAPELLGSSRQNMMRALLLSSALVILSFVAAGFALMRMPPPPPSPEPVIWMKPHPIGPMPTVRSPEWVRPTGTKAPDQGRPIPIHEDMTHPDAPPLPDAPTADPGTAPGTGTIGDIGEPDPTTNQNPPLPRIDEVVYFDEMPVEAYRVEPVYPEIAKEAKIEGLVYARMLVGRDGHVLDVQIAPKFSIPILNEAVIVAARQWIFRPAMVNKHPVAVWVGVRFNFKLH